MTALVTQSTSLATLAVQSLGSPSSRRNYAREIKRYLSTGRPLNRENVQAYMNSLRDSNSGSATRNIALAAIKLLAREAYQRRQLSDVDLNGIDNVRSARVLGHKVGNWLDLGSVKALIAQAGAMEHGARNRAIVACMAGCGLRRDEVVRLTWGQLQQREYRYVWTDIEGKGGRIRSVPVPRWAARFICDWQAQSATGDDNKALAFRMSGQNAYLIVCECAKRAGLGEIRPHDLRRTYARLSREGGAAIEQISQTLGHASVQTTERYLGTRLEMRDGMACGDHIKLEE